MLGFSVYFEKNTNIKKQVLDNKDFDIVFTSLHYPADDGIFEEFIKLYELCRKNNIKICVDINNKTLKNHPEIQKMDLILRLDFGFAINEISKLSKETELAINASTVGKDLLDKLSKSGCYMENIAAIHNFYPLEYSGIGEEFFKKQNHMLKSYGLKLGAFVPGDERLRGPVFKGLPTLEDDRYKKPYQSFVKLNRKYQMDLIFLAEGLSQREMNYIKKYTNDKIISLPSSIEESYKELKNIKVRPDISDYLIRNQRVKKDIPPSNPQKINRGDIVILNNNSGRYAGEIEIIKKDLGEDNKRNVIGKVDTNYQEILNYVKGGDLIEFDRR